MRASDAPDKPTAYRIEIPTRHGTDNQQPLVVAGHHFSSSDLVGLSLVVAVRRSTWGKSRIGKPPRNKARARMARESRRRNRG